MIVSDERVMILDVVEQRIINFSPPKFDSRVTMIALECSQIDHHKHASKNSLQCWCPIRAHIVASGDGRHGATRPAVWILAISPRKKKEADPFGCWILFSSHFSRGNQP